MKTHDNIKMLCVCVCGGGGGGGEAGEQINLAATTGIKFAYC